MKRDDKLISQILGPVRQYLDGELRAEELVRIVDDLVANDFLHGLELRLVALIERLHVALSLYVCDEQTRKQEPGVYLGDVELRQKAIEFYEAIRSI